LRVFTIPAGVQCTNATFTNYETYNSAYVFNTTLPAGFVVQINGGFGANGISRLPAGNAISGTGVGLFNYYFTPSTRNLTVVIPKDYRGSSLPTNLVDLNTGKTLYPFTAYLTS
jgi:hypothetical protein